jgi:hypothetical protein
MILDFPITRIRSGDSNCLVTVINADLRSGQFHRVGRQSHLDVFTLETGLTLEFPLIAPLASFELKASFSAPFLCT